MSESIRGLSDEEQKILTTIACALPYMREFDKGYLLAMGESMANWKKMGEVRIDSVGRLKKDESVQTVK